jgi:hypothetical protein
VIRAALLALHRCVPFGILSPTKVQPPLILIDNHIFINALPVHHQLTSSQLSAFGRWIAFFSYQIIPRKGEWQPWSAIARMNSLQISKADSILSSTLSTAMDSMDLVLTLTGQPKSATNILTHCTLLYPLNGHTSANPGGGLFVHGHSKHRFIALLLQVQIIVWTFPKFIRDELLVCLLYDLLPISLIPSEQFV